MLTYTLFAFLSGVTALVYQVVWTREVALFLGSQIEAISIVLVAFFGGLAAGARYFGARADRVRAPLRLFGILEGAAGALAAASPALLQWLAASPLLGLPPPARFAIAAAALFPVAFLLGGTAPALLRAGVREIARTAAGVGWIVGANTAGAVLGVGVAIAAIPAWGLRATLSTAGVTALLLGAAAFFLARPMKHPASSSEPPFRIPTMPLAAAFAAGIATLVYEVLAARAAALLLGSTLYAWGCVLALLLAGLALGTAIFGHRAGRTAQPELELGLIESAAALAIAAELIWFVPDYALPAAGLSGWTGGLIALSVFPPAIFMGGAFPYLVRLSVGNLGTLGRAFGTVSALNTAGGIAGSLLAPFLLLPALGLLKSLLFCAGLNGLLGAVFLLRGSVRPRQGWGRAALVVL
ncbi:MAG: fused MFS/spermidine synthase [Deltaproteobacteria bacterium]|nr:fused MFS/spermidine synthase [Deltaproteobacteria bacterium]